MHRIILTAGIIVSVIALIVFSNFLRDADGNPDIEIKPAPIHEVDISIAESYPEQVFVYIKGGLPDGCTEFNDFDTGISGNTINITLTIKRPKDAVCAAVYGYFEKNIALGTAFIRGETYTVNVNGTAASFTYPQSQSDEQMEISLAPIHEVDTDIAKSNPEQILVYIKGGLADGCTSLKDITTEKDGNIINITVTVQRPKDAMCVQVYSYFEEIVNLGSDFTRGQSYTVNVNGVIVQFTYPL